MRRKNEALMMVSYQCCCNVANTAPATKPGLPVVTGSSPQPPARASHPTNGSSPPVRVVRPRGVEGGREFVRARPAHTCYVVGRFFLALDPTLGTRVNQVTTIASLPPAAS